MDGIISVLRPPRYPDPTPPQKMRPMCRTGSAVSCPMEPSLRFCLLAHEPHTPAALFVSAAGTEQTLL